MNERKLATRVLVTGWASFPDGEATAGDVLAMEAVTDALDGAGISVDQAWSPVFRPGALALADADLQLYTHLVFACGPVYGQPVAWLHRRFAGCRRIAVGVTVPPGPPRWPAPVPRVRPAPALSPPRSPPNCWRRCADDERTGR